MQAPATDTLDNSSPEERLRALGIELPPARAGRRRLRPGHRHRKPVDDVGAIALDCRRLEVQGQDRRGIVDRARLSGVPLERAQRDFADQEGARQPRSRAADRAARRHARLRAGLHRAAGACSTAPRMSSTRYSVRAAAIPAWSIPTTQCRWIARRSSCFSPRSPPRAKRRRIAAQIPVSAPRCGRKGFC